MSDIPIGIRVSDLMRQRHMIPSKVADVAGLSRSTVTRIVNGERHPSMEVLRDIAAALSVDMDTLMSGTDAVDARTGKVGVMGCLSCPFRSGRRCRMDDDRRACFSVNRSTAVPPSWCRLRRSAVLVHLSVRPGRTGTAKQ